MVSLHCIRCVYLGFVSGVNFARSPRVVWVVIYIYGCGANALALALGTTVWAMMTTTTTIDAARQLNVDYGACAEL